MVLVALSIYALVAIFAGVCWDPTATLGMGFIGLILGLGVAVAPAANTTAFFDPLSGREVGRDGKPLYRMPEYIAEYGPVLGVALGCMRFLVLAVVFMALYGTYALVRWVILWTVTAGADGLQGEYLLTTQDVRWGLKLDGRGKFSVTRNGEEGVHGTYKVSDTEIEFTDEGGPLLERYAEEMRLHKIAPEAVRTGLYRWGREVTSINFTKINDASPWRQDALTWGSWQKLR